jgi:proteasome lid subunit RPN8/RPN11
MSPQESTHADAEEYAGEPPLEIPPAIVAAMIEHCRREAPREACGILAGADVPRVETLFPLRNRLASATLYDADPHDLIRAVQAMRASNQRMLALYHSHPETSPIPSRTDLDRNYYGPLPRVIVSLCDEPPEVRVWRLESDGYSELPWRVTAAVVEPERASD